MLILAFDDSAIEIGSVRQGVLSGDLSEQGRTHFEGVDGMEFTPEWISAVAEGVTALTVVVGVVALKQTRTALSDSHEQLKIANKQLESANRQQETANAQQKTASDQLIEARRQATEDHDRSRREDAIQYLLTWTNSLTVPTTSARRLADRIGEAACLKIFNMESVDIDLEHSHLVQACLPEIKLDGSLQTRPVRLTPRESAEIRFLLIKYLNTLETVLSAWRHRSADRVILEEQFKFLHRPTAGSKMLKDFRTAAGEEFYPAIAEFEEFLREQRSPRPSSRKELGDRPATR